MRIIFIDISMQISKLLSNHKHAKYIYIILFILDNNVHDYLFQ